MLNRRCFLSTAAVGLSAAIPATVAVPAWGVNETVPEPQHFLEPERNLPLKSDSDCCDIIVCGGGPAGVSAAVAAARAGARVRLFEMHGSLGGIWTSGLLTYIFDFDKSPLGLEIIERLDKLNARRCASKRDFVYEPEYMKLVCEEMCAEAGVQVQLYTSVATSYRDPTGKNVQTIITESKSGREAWRAKYFIDCTGDGDLAAQSGCGFDMGFTPEGFGQPATLNALVVVRDATKMSQFISNDPAMWGPGGHVDSFRAFLKEIERAGMEPSYFNPTLFKVHENLLLLMINHEYKVRVDDAAAISAATIRARSEILRITSALNQLGGVWEGMRVAATAEQIGHRTCRRIHGRYTLTREDVAAGRKFDDAVTTSRFGVDIHAIDFKSNKTKTISSASFKPFQIPLRSLLAKDADNLFMAGRCISGDHIAHASYRVTGSAVAMGEAIGKHAAGLVSQGNATFLQTQVEP